jgi:hypothetical protein
MNIIHFTKQIPSDNKENLMKFINYELKEKLPNEYIEQLNYSYEGGILLNFSDEYKNKFKDSKYDYLCLDKKKYRDFRFLYKNNFIFGLIPKNNIPYYSEEEINIIKDIVDKFIY